MTKKTQIPWGKIIVAIWLTLSTLYVALAEYGRLTMFVAQNAYQNGYRDSVITLLSEVSKCQPVPVNFENKTVHVIGVDCLKTPESGGKASASENASANSGANAANK